MKQVGDLGNVKCARCGIISNLVEYTVDKDGKAIVICIRCRDEREQ